MRSIENKEVMMIPLVVLFERTGTKNKESDSEPKQAKSQNLFVLASLRHRPPFYTFLDRTEKWERSQRK